MLVLFTFFFLRALRENRKGEGWFIPQVKHILPETFLPALARPFPAFSSSVIIIFEENRILALVIPLISGDTVKIILLVIAAVMVFCTSARADCQWDCTARYTSEVKICETIHNNQLDNVDQMTCINNSMDAFKKCMAGCT